jgi:hypothetical protein
VKRNAFNTVYSVLCTLASDGDLLVGLILGLLEQRLQRIRATLHVISLLSDN